MTVPLLSITVVESGPYTEPVKSPTNPKDAETLPVTCAPSIVVSNFGLLLKYKVCPAPALV